MVILISMQFSLFQLCQNDFTWHIEYAGDWVHEKVNNQKYLEVSMLQTCQTFSAFCLVCCFYTLVVVQNLTQNFVRGLHIIQVELLLHFPLLLFRTSPWDSMTTTTVPVSLMIWRSFGTLHHVRSIMTYNMYLKCYHRYLYVKFEFHSQFMNRSYMGTTIATTTWTVCTIMTMR